MLAQKETKNNSSTKPLFSHLKNYSFKLEETWCWAIRNGLNNFWHIHNDGMLKVSAEDSVLN